MITVEPDETAKILAEATEQADTRRGKPGRIPTTRRRKEMERGLRTGQVDAIDRSWLLEQLLSVYKDASCKAQDRLRALELMAKVSGYGNRAEEPESEREAIAELMESMKQP